MCLLDARCRCETGQCSHIGGAIPFNALLNPQQFLLQNQQAHETFPLISLPQKLMPGSNNSNNSSNNNNNNDNDQIGATLVKKLKRENDFTGNNNENVTQQSDMKFSMQQPNFLPILSQLQQLNYLNNQTAPSNNQVTAPFPLKTLPSPFMSQNSVSSSQTQLGQNAGSSSTSMNSSTSNIEATLKDMQARVMGMFAFQSKMLTDLQEKSSIQSQTISMLYEEVKQLRTFVTSQPSIESAAEPAFTAPTIYSQMCGSNENGSLGGPISPHGLIQFLFKKKESDYKYKLILNQALDQPLYRERNFNISVSLVNRNDDSAVSNVNRIPLNISIYTSENPPKFIDTNTSGNKILKGFTEKDLQHGSVTFDKIQIKEVTSHFRNGWVFLVIFPKALNYESGKTTHHKDDIDINEIRPLVIEKVIVKAKKLKEGKKHSKESSSFQDDESKEQDRKIESD